MVSWVPPHASAGLLRGTLVEIPGTAWQRSGETPAHWGRLHVQSVSVGISPLGGLRPMRAESAMPSIFIFSNSSLGMGDMIRH